MGDVCPICERGVPNDAVAELPGAWVTLPPRAPVPGYVVVVAKRHVREPFELPASERREFWDAVDLVASATRSTASQNSRRSDARSSNGSRT